ncbi:hypothetical protein ACFL1N_04495 [Thermodesulfobacteriota bacterium]
MSQYVMNIAKHRSFKFTFRIIALIVIGLILIWGRAFYGSISDYHKAETYNNSNQIIRAINFYDRSIHWYVPFNIYIQKSAERLWEIGEEAEEKDDIKLALIAFRTIRRGFYASRSIYQPGSEWIKRCDARIDYLNGLVSNGEKAASGSSGIEKWPVTENRKDVNPNIAWTIILEIGFIGWIGSVICFIFSLSRTKEDERYPVSSVITYTVITIIFFAAWVFGMMKV